MRCPVCTSDCNDGGNFAQGHLLTCVRCGRFLLSRSAESELPAKVNENHRLQSVLSSFIRQQQRPERPPVITTHTIEALKDEALDSPAEQIDRLILWIGSNQPSPVQFAEATRYEVGARIGSYKMRPDAEDGFQWLHQQISSEGLYILDERPQSPARFQLTMKGWDRYQSLKLRVEESRTAFMAMKFGDSELDAVIENHFRGAVELAGFKLHLLTDNQTAGLIDNQIRAAIRTAAFVIADLTHDNNGAYFEAGFAEGLGLHVIYTCKADKFRARKTHFDTNHMVTIPWDPADLHTAAKLLTSTIRATLPTRAKMGDEPL